MLENPRGAALWRWPRKQQDRVSHISAFYHPLRTATAGNVRMTGREFCHYVLLSGGGSVQECLGYGISHIVAFNRAHCCIEPPICLAHVHFLCDFLCLSYQSKGHGLMQKAQPLQCTFICFRLNNTKISILCGTSAFWVSQGKRGQRRSMSLCSILLLC